MPTLHWDEIPFVRLLLPFIVGILIAIYTNFVVGKLLCATLIFFCLLFLIAISKKLQQYYRFSYLFGLFLNVFMIVLGYAITFQKTELNHNTHFSYHLTDSSFVQIKVEESLVEKNKSYKANISVLTVWNGTEQVPVTGDAIAYFQKDSLPSSLEYGAILLCNAPFQPISEAKNPNAFDYQKYLRNLGIHHQVYLKKTDWELMSMGQGNWVLTKIYYLRNYLLNVIEQYIQGKEEVAIAAALLLGYKSLLERDVVQLYSHTGAMHVLAVSGLHVGIIFMVISSLLQFLDQWGNKAILLKVALILWVIWSFALIAGLPPSVFRAATMFSFFAVGKLLKRPPNFYNILAASAFLLLCLNPYFLLQVGFQLSYAAIFAIVALQPVIYRWFTIKNVLLDKAWQITAVSIAAQIGTLPISVYYFHQFPTYALLSNLVVIPIAGIILQLGLLLFVLSPVPLLAKCIGSILYYIIFCLNYCLGWVQQLPLSKISGLTITWSEVYLWYFVFLGLILFFWTKKARPLFGALGGLIILLCLGNLEQWQQSQQKQLTVYHIKQGTAIDFIRGNSNVCIGDRTLYQNKQQNLQFNVQPNWRQLGIKQSNLFSLPQKCEGKTDTLLQQSLLWQYPFAHFLDKQIMIIAGRPPTYEPPTSEIGIDYLILTQNAKIDFRYWNNCWRIDKVIMDASNSRWRINKWKQQCKFLGIDYYDVTEKGAFTVKL